MFELIVKKSIHGSKLRWVLRLLHSLSLDRVITFSVERTMSKYFRLEKQQNTSTSFLALSASSLTLKARAHFEMLVS